MDWAWWAAYLGLGLFVGFFAGLLGIGGGMMLVSVLVMAFGAQHLPEDRLVHMAIGTSLASIVLTSLSSIRAHAKRGVVRWDILRQMVPGIVLGTLLGAGVADALPSRQLVVFFLGFMCYSTVQMWLDLKPSPTRQLPGRVGLALAGLVTGTLSAMIGVGGAFITIPLLTACNVPMLNAIGTSAAVGLPIALAGAIGYAWTGLGKPGLPAMTLGYIHLPALAGIVIGTFVTVPYGARAAHAWPVKRLKRIFAVLLLILTAKMASRLF
jgi:uncharacterized membrane protein YfcA